MTPTIIPTYKVTNEEQIDIHKDSIACILKYQGAGFLYSKLVEFCKTIYTAKTGKTATRALIERAWERHTGQWRAARSTDSFKAMVFKFHTNSSISDQEMKKWIKETLGETPKLTTIEKARRQRIVRPSTPEELEQISNMLEKKASLAMRFDNSITNQAIC